MAYTKSDMVYNDYKWSAKADHDNPKITGGTDHAELNRTEGYEMLYFINHLATKWNWSETNKLANMKELEKIIRTEVPSSIRSHTKIADWISTNYEV